MTGTQVDAVVKTIDVKATPERAFEIFTAGHDSWWPKTHHVGKSKMVRGVFECRLGGRCYSEHEDGSQVDWGKVLVWEPPQRLVMAWMVTHQWGANPNLEQASEVEVRFTAIGKETTRVELEHRHFERMGPGGAEMRTAVNNGWPKLMEMFAARCEQA